MQEVVDLYENFKSSNDFSSMANLYPRQKFLMGMSFNTTLTSLYVSSNMICAFMFSSSSLLKNLRYSGVLVHSTHLLPSIATSSNPWGKVPADRSRSRGSVQKRQAFRRQNLAARRSAQVRQDAQLSNNSMAHYFKQWALLIQKQTYQSYRYKCFDWALIAFFLRRWVRDSSSGYIQLSKPYSSPAGSSFLYSSTFSNLLQKATLSLNSPSYYINRGCLAILEKVILFLLSTTKIRLKKSYNSGTCYFNLSFLVNVAERLKDGLLQRRVIQAFIS